MSSNQELTRVNPRQKQDGDDDDGSSLQDLTAKFDEDYRRLENRFQTYHTNFVRNSEELKRYQEKRMEITESLPGIVQAMKGLRSGVEELNPQGEAGQGSKDFEAGGDRSGGDLGSSNSRGKSKWRRAITRLPKKSKDSFCSIS